MAFIQAAVYGFYGYLFAGLLFAAWFAFRGAGKLDPAMQASKWHVRLLLIPAAALLWPVLLVKLRQRQASTSED